MSTYALLEGIGVLSFNLPTDRVQKLFTLLPKRYGLQVAPLLDTSQAVSPFSLSAILSPK
jgi:hypothetical protein